MTTNVQTNPNALKGSRRQFFVGATKLVAKSLIESIDLPGLRESTRTACDTILALKAPKNNDVKARELKDRVEDVLAQIKSLVGAAGRDVESEEFQKSYPGPLVAIKKLEGIKTELATIMFEKYTTKLALQEDIERFLGKKEQELQAVIQDFCVSR